MSDAERASSRPATPPPCAAAPQRWLDRADRVQALETCLQCPVRRWCAQEALRLDASWGMWAGIWVDGRADATPRLQAIAAEPAPTAATPVTDSPAVPHPDARLPLPPALRHRQGRRVSVAARVLARSSGHCEILGPGCHLTSRCLQSRVVGLPADRATSAADVYAACRSCAEAAVIIPADIAESLGHLVDSPGQAVSTPFRWRGSRWVLLGPYGELHEADLDIRRVRAC